MNGRTKAWAKGVGLAGVLALGAAACDAVLGIDVFDAGPIDSGPMSHDGGRDAPAKGRDASIDARHDAGFDAARDAARDRGVDSPSAHEAAPLDAGGSDATDASLPDGAFDGACAASSGSCVAALPSGWSLVLYAPVADAGCPTSFGSTRALSNAEAGAGSCGCGACSFSALPSCEIGSLVRQIGSTNTCAQLGPTLMVDGAGCTGWPGAPGTLSPFVKGNPIAPSGGACTAPATSDPAKIMGTQGTTCTPPASCDEAVCEGVFSTGFSLCLTKSGTATECPSGWGSPVIIGNGVDLTCATCACNPLGATTCSNPTIAYFSDSTCLTVPEATLAVTDVCAANPGSGDTVNAFEYKATLQASCTASGTYTATTTLKNKQTLCCP